MKYFQKLAFLVLILTWGAFDVRSQDEAANEDAIYDESIKTVLLYPTVAAEQDIPERMVAPPIIPLGSKQALNLEFDDLSGSFRNFRAKIFHCNADWTPSALNEIEFTYQANNYPITKFAQSYSTKVPYVHYSLFVPSVKLSGNYTLAVFDQHTGKAVFSRRFMVYQQLVQISASARFSQGIQEKQTDQQIDFTISYAGYELVSPQTDLLIYIRQNFRWDKMKSGFVPSNIDPFEKKLSFQFFNLENAFKGSNEFRYFDSRSLGGRGFGIAQINRKEDFTELVLAPDEPRFDKFIQVDDLNGQFFIERKEGGRSAIEAEYTPVIFSLKSSDEADIYVNGAFNLWQRNELNKMSLDSSTGAHHAKILLKQGIISYDYGVLLDDGVFDEEILEGSFGETENDYDILVYRRPPGSRADALVGYTTVEWNRRR